MANHLISQCLFPYLQSRNNDTPLRRLEGLEGDELSTKGGNYVSYLWLQQSATNVTDNHMTTEAYNNKLLTHLSSAGVQLAALLILTGLIYVSRVRLTVS